VSGFIPRHKIIEIMLIVNNFDSLVASRLLEFFDFRTPWHRRLWATGLILTLRELLEASEMVAAKVLFQNSVKALADTAIILAGSDPGVAPGDPGVGSSQYKRKLHKLLLSDLNCNSIEFLELVQIADDIQSRYLKNWSDALQAHSVVPGALKAERSARAIAAHLLDLGFSAEFLFGWWRWNLTKNPVQQTLPEILLEVHSLALKPEKQFQILVAFRESPSNKTGFPESWVAAQEVTLWLKENGFSTEGLRQSGGMWLDVSARDAWGAVQAAGETIDRFAARVQLGTRGQLLPLPDVYIKAHPKAYPLRQRRRRVEVDALHRESQLYSAGANVSRVDSAIELLSPLDASSPSTAVAGGWAAVEAILTAPGDTERLSAGYRMAALVTSSFPRAELTALSYKMEKRGGALAHEISMCATNRDRAARVLEHIRSGEPSTLEDPSDLAAVDRLREVLANPQKKLNDINNHLSSVFRGLYRNRNIVLHGGKTDAVGLRSSLRNAAPLVGAGMDRIAHAWFVEGTEPVEVAARAGVRLATAGAPEGPDLIDLLAPA
jgi:hypothetical protein